MRTFINENFLLENEYAVELYQQFAKDLPIIDTHNHLSAQYIAENHQFETISELWLADDHYKWRAMRSHGIAERFITGDASDWEKFEQWANVLPYTLRNPLYHWSHLELQHYFGIEELLTPENAAAIYKNCNEALAKDENRVGGLLKKIKIEILCTLNDPTDELQFYKQLQDKDLGIQLRPTFHADKFILIDHSNFNDYVQQLGEATDIEIHNFDSLLEALHKRMDYFHTLGCRLSSQSMGKVIATDFMEAKVNQTLARKLRGRGITGEASAQYQSAILHYLGLAYQERNWVQQLHLGALRNQNTRLQTTIDGPTACDSIGDLRQVRSLGKYLNRLDTNNQLPRTVLYNMNPRDNEAFVTMAGNFSTDGIKGKVQSGLGWWYLNQQNGLERQLNAMSDVGLLSSSIGVISDSRSFLSLSRHDYFRRLVCTIFGKDIAKGYLPNDLAWVGKVIQDICYHNATAYFQE